MLATIRGPRSSATMDVMGMAPPGSMTASTVRVAIPLIAVGDRLVLLSFLFGQVGSTTSAGGSPKAGFRNLDLVIAIALVFSAGFTWIGGASRRVVVLAAVSGLAWLGPDVVLAPASPAIIRLVAVGLAPLWPVVVLHLVLAAPSHGRPDPGANEVLDGTLRGRRSAVGRPSGHVRPLLRAGLHAVVQGRPSHHRAPGRDCALSCVRVCMSSASSRGRWLLVGPLTISLHGGLRGRDRWTLVGGLIGGVATTGFALIELARVSTI